MFRCWNIGIMTYQIRHDEVSGFGVREDLAEPEGVDSHRCHEVEKQAWFEIWGLGFGIWGWGRGVWGLGFGVWSLGLGVWGVGFGGLGCIVWGLGFGRANGLRSKVWGVGVGDREMFINTNIAGMYATP